MGMEEIWNRRQKRGWEKMCHRRGIEEFLEDYSKVRPAT
jgi:hypothetical protein